MSTLQHSYQPLADDSDISKTIMQIQANLDERQRLVKEMMAAKVAGDEIKAAELRRHLFAR